MDDNRITYFAATDSRGRRVPFGLKARDRSRHMYVIGKSGMGKSTLLENMAIQDIRNGEGVAFIDPHGETADKLLEYVPQHRINDVVYFAPFDMDQPIAFNVMEDVGYDKRHLVVSGLMATFKKIWVDAWSARMEYILTNTLLALLEYPDATLMDVSKMYSEDAFRWKVVDNIKDPAVKNFWVSEYAHYTERYLSEAIPPIQNKIGQFTANPLIRNIISQPKSSFDVRDMMDQRKILIINLSKGQVGDTNMRLLGSMLTTRIFLGAMSRAELPREEIAKLPSFYFYVDEFQNFANETFAEILSEARKYKLALIIAHQYVEQMEEEVRAAVFGNVGTTISFRVGPFDAQTLETVFAPEFTKEDLVNLGLRQIYLTMMIDNVGSRPFSAVTIPPIEAPPRTYRTEVIQASRKQFGAPRSEIEARMMARVEQQAEAAALQASKKQGLKGGPKKALPAPTSQERRAHEQNPRRALTEEQIQQTQRTGSGAGLAPRPPRTDRPAPADQTDRERSNRLERPAQTDRQVSKPQTSEDLKSILRAMTANVSPPPAAEPRPKANIGASGAPTPAAQSEAPSASPLKGALNDVLPPKPYEIPEDTLRALFKEE